jgi:hypothetical protein
LFRIGSCICGETETSSNWSDSTEPRTCIYHFEGENVQCCAAAACEARLSSGLSPHLSSQPFQFRASPLLPCQLQTEPRRCSRRVAAALFRIGSGVFDKLTLVRIGLTPPDRSACRLTSDDAVRKRQTDGKAGAFAQFGFRGNCSACTIDDLAADGKPKPGAAAGFGCEEWVED